MFPSSACMTCGTILSTLEPLVSLYKGRKSYLRLTTKKCKTSLRNKSSLPSTCALLSSFLFTSLERVWEFRENLFKLRKDRLSVARAHEKEKIKRSVT